MSDNTNSAQERTASIDLAQLDALDRRARDEKGEGYALMAIKPTIVRDLIALARRSLTSGAPAAPSNSLEFDGIKTDVAAPSVELIELLKAIRPNYGAVGSRDVDVTAQRNRIDRAIELLSAGAAAKTEQADGTVIDYGTMSQATAAGAGSAQPRAEGDERTDFEREVLRLDIVEGAWSGVNSSEGWYYFDDGVNACWETWKARAALARSPLPADETVHRLHKLREEVAMMYQMLDDGEWAEHLAVTPEGQCLETAITKLVGKANRAQPVDDARDAARLDMIDQIIRENGYIYLHNNRAREPIGLLVKPGELREALDGLMERRAAMRANDGAAEGGA